jgi:pyridoxamine 5'-phosphate oxidase
MLARIPLVCIYLSTATHAFTPLLSSSSAVRSLSSVNMSTNNESNVGFADSGAQSSPPTSSIEEITTWREKISTSIARSKKVRGGNYVQIATVDPETLEPRCRTVVFRGFLKQNGKEADIMKMITDKRSSKYTEVTKSPSGDTKKATCEMVWWFGKSSEQYRIRGNLKFIGDEETDEALIIARKEQWGNMSDPAREQFFWKGPGLPFDSPAEVPEGGRDEEGKVLPPPNNFLLMLLYPTRCDYLRLTDNLRQFDSIKEDLGWDAQQVTP